jgi:hypothetical protein
MFPHQLHAPQGSARDRERRDKERQQLADLVGKNLTYLSQLDGLDLPLYRDVLLPRCGARGSNILLFENEFKRHLGFTLWHFYRGVVLPRCGRLGRIVGV